MLTQLAYFTKKPLLIPQAQPVPSVSQSVPSAAAGLTQFFEAEEEQLLINILGIVLYEELKPHIGATSLNANAPQKWKDFVEGKNMVIEDRTLQYKGLLGNDGLLANYMFCRWMKSGLYNTTIAGVKAVDTENSNEISSIPVYVNAWRRFFELYQGNATYNLPDVYSTDFGYGIDWYKANQGFLPLCAFMEESTDFNLDYFKIESNQNSFGI